MSDATSSKLDQAYDLIQQEKLDEATHILDDVLEQQPDNVDAWWLKANAVSDPDDARYALGQVLKYDPDHQEALGLIDQLNEAYPPESSFQDAGLGFTEGDMDFDSLFGDTGSQPPAPPTIPDFPEVLSPRITRLGDESSAAPSSVDLTDLFDIGSEESESSISDLEFNLDEDDLPPDFDIESDEPTQTPAARRPIRRRLLLVAVLAVVIVGLLAAVVLSRQNRGTATVVQPTNVTTPSVIDATPPDGAASETNIELVLNSIQEAANAQSQLLGGESTVNLQDRQLGTTLVLQVCRSAGTDLPAAMNAGMQLAASQGSNLQGEIAAIAVDLVNCQRDDVLMRASVPIARAVEYASQGISDEIFRASWQLEY